MMTVKSKSKVAFIILSPSTIEASHPGLMRQFELYTIITQHIALMSVAACQASGRFVSVIPWQGSQRLCSDRHCHRNSTPAGFEPSPNQPLQQLVGC